MNQITIIEREGDPRYDIAVDGKRLAEHFVGRNGAHPSEVATIGWKHAAFSSAQDILQQLQGLRDSGLKSGRVPILVCEECGDLGCGTIAARIKRMGTIVTWSDWAYENGYEPASNLDWPIKPSLFQFELAAYERALTIAAPSG